MLQRLDRHVPSNIADRGRVCGTDPAMRYLPPHYLYAPLHQRLSHIDLVEIRHVVVSRWSKSEPEQAADQLRRTLATHAAVPEIAGLDATVPADAVALTVGDIIEPQPGDKISAAREIGVLWTDGPVLIVQLAFSGSTAGQVTTPMGGNVLVVAEAVIQLVRAVRHAQATRTPLALRTSEDWTRTARVMTEAERLYTEVVEKLHAEWFLGAAPAPKEQIVRAVHGSQAQADGAKVVRRTTEGLVDHLPNPQRAPVAESKLPVWRRHVRDETALDGRARAGKVLLAEWDVSVVPAVQAALRAVASGATADELAAIGVAHRIPTSGRTNGPRTSTMDQVGWYSARRRMRRLLQIGDGGLIPADADVDTDLDVRHRLARVIAARDGLEIIRHRIPSTEPTDLTTYGHVQLPVHRERPGDRGYVQVERPIGWPPRHTVVTDTRTITVPLGTFPTASPVLGLVETPISATEAQVEVPIGVLGDPVVDRDGLPVPWTRLGVANSVYDVIIERWRQPATNEGGRRLRHDRTSVVPTIPDLSAVIDGQERTVRLRPIGPPHARVRQVWARPTGITGGWRLERLRRLEDRLLIGDVDVTSWRIGSIQERRLLKSVADALETAATTAMAAAGELELVVPTLSRPDPTATATATADRLAARAADLRTQADQADGDATGQELMAGRALSDGREDDADRYEVMATDLRAQAADLRAQADQLDAQADAVVTDAATAEDGQVDVSRLAHLLAAMQVVSDPTHATPGLVEGDATVIAELVHRMLPTESDWTVTIDVDRNELSWTATAVLDTRDNGQLRLPLSGTVPMTGYRQKTEGSGIPGLVARWMTGELATIDDLQAAGPRNTSRAAVVKTWIRPALGEVYVVGPQRRMALADHPYPVVRAAVHAAVTGERPTPAPWTAAWEEHIATTYRDTAGWNDSACPVPLVDAAIIIGCLAQGPATVDQLATATGIDATVIRRLARPRPPYSGGPGRPTLVNQHDPNTLLALHDCPHSGCGGVADVLAFLPETHVAAGAPGGVLCSSCMRIPHPDLAHVIFPPVYRETVTRDPALDARHGSITNAPTTVSMPAVHVPVMG